MENPVEVKEREAEKRRLQIEGPPSTKDEKARKSSKNKQLQISERDPIAKKVAMTEHKR